MAPIATYVFIGLKSRGLPDTEPAITHLNMIAVKSESFRNMEAPGNLEIQTKEYFDQSIDVRSVFVEFLEHLEKPVCLIAHNAFRYDYPLLKRRLGDNYASFSENILCADAMHAFYDILEPDNHKTSKAARLGGAFPWTGYCIRKGSYSWEDLFRRELNDDPPFDRNTAVLKIAEKLSNQFAEWLEENNFLFDDIPFLEYLFSDSSMVGGECLLKKQESDDPGQSPGEIVSKLEKVE